MGRTLPTPKPDVQNRKILHLAKRFVSLPFVLVRGICRTFGRLWGCGRSAAQVRSDDQLRQSRIRRDLRGLPPDHVQQ